MIWTPEVKAIWMARHNGHITSDELLECYSVTQRKPRELRWRAVDTVRYLMLRRRPVDRLTPSRP